MALHVPIGELKDTVKFHSVIEVSKEPLVLSRDDWGVSDVAVPEAYGSLKSEIAHERLMHLLDCAEAEFDSGSYLDGDSYLDALLERCNA